MFSNRFALLLKVTLIGAFAGLTLHFISSPAHTRLTQTTEAADTRVMLTAIRQLPVVSDLPTASFRPHEPLRPRDSRAVKLERYLNGKYSVLASQADLIIELSDYYDVDYKMIIGISAVETGYCQYAVSYNCWGFGRFRWNDPESAVREYMDLMNSNYFRKGMRTVEEIASIYNPTPEEWSAKVRGNMAEVP